MSMPIELTKNIPSTIDKLYADHKKLARRKQELKSKLHSTNKLSITRPLVALKLSKADKAYKQNLTASEEHYRTRSQAYRELVYADDWQRKGSLAINPEDPKSHVSATQATKERLVDAIAYQALAGDENDDSYGQDLRFATMDEGTMSASLSKKGTTFTKTGNEEIAELDYVVNKKSVSYALFHAPDGEIGISKLYYNPVTRSKRETMDRSVYSDMGTLLLTAMDGIRSHEEREDRQNALGINFVSEAEAVKLIGLVEQAQPRNQLNYW